MLVRSSFGQGGIRSLRAQGRDAIAITEGGRSPPNASDDYSSSQTIRISQSRCAILVNVWVVSSAPSNEPTCCFKVLRQCMAGI
mmetsp:Transcript_19391/g.43728  ORF Transcript_19391/g.43728 Transcript_19391/m.43728 type:complete len:84 (+) Transcript_19391:120-371(+)